MASYSSSNRKNCQVEGCNSSVINMSPHLEDVHGWGKAKRKQGLIRKDYVYKNPLNKVKTIEKEHGKVVRLHKNYHQRRLCPVAGYQSENKRMPAHLQEVTFIMNCSDFYTGHASEHIRIKIQAFFIFLFCSESAHRAYVKLPKH